MKIVNVNQVENAYAFRNQLPGGGKYHRFQRLLKAHEQAERVVLNREAAIKAVGVNWPLGDTSQLKSELSEAEVRLKEISRQLDETILEAAGEIRKRREGI